MFDDIKNLVIEFNEKVYRNRKTIKPAQDLFDDLSDDPAKWKVAITLDRRTRPHYPHPSIIHAPFAYFKDAQNKNHPWPSRFSDGGFPVWYGSIEYLTTTYETLYHFINDFHKSDISDVEEPIIGDREIFKVLLKSEICDLRDIKNYDLTNPTNYTDCQKIGKWKSENKYSGLLTKSARYSGTNVVCFKESALSDEENFCYVKYRYYPSSNSAVVTFSDNEFRVKIKTQNDYFELIRLV